MSEPARPILLFDGSCGFCLAWVERFRRFDREGHVEFIAAEDRDRDSRVSDLSSEALARAVHLVLPDGRIFTGARTLRPLLSLLPRWKVLAPILRLPGVEPLADRVYAWIAARRHRFGCSPEGCGAGSTRLR